MLAKGRNFVQSGHTARRTPFDLFLTFSPKIIFLFFRAHSQCDQSASLFFIIWQFTAKKICPIAEQMCQRRFKLLPNSKQAMRNCKLLLMIGQSYQIWRNLVTLATSPTCLFLSLVVGLPMSFSYCYYYLLSRNLLSFLTLIIPICLVLKVPTFTSFLWSFLSIGAGYKLAKLQSFVLTQGL